MFEQISGVDSASFVPGVYTDIKAVSSEYLETLQKAAANWGGGEAIVEIILQGTENETVERAGGLFALRADVINTTYDMQKLTEARRRNPQTAKRHAERILREGGAIVRLTLHGDPSDRPSKIIRRFNNCVREYLVDSELDIPRRY